jgi:hypothetical protein
MEYITKGRELQQNIGTKISKKKENACPELG